MLDEKVISKKRPKRKYCFRQGYLPLGKSGGLIWKRLSFLFRMLRAHVRDYLIGTDQNIPD